MRNDALGLFWEDRPPEKKAPPEKRTPPENTWDDSLPYYEEAEKFNIRMYDFAEILNSGEEQIFDTETYPNYFCICFMGLESEKVFYFELTDEDERISGLEKRQMVEILKICPIVGFNSIAFDLPIIEAYMYGLSAKEIWDVAQSIIVDNMRSYGLYSQHNFERLEFRSAIKHIDLMQVAPSKASLKLYACRLHLDKIQDLPYDPKKELSAEQKLVVLWYCVNDLHSTRALRVALDRELLLRSELSKEYRQSMLSRSDAQIAEDILFLGIYRATGKRPRKHDYKVGEKIFYRPPKWIQFQTKFMQEVLEEIMHDPFVVNPYGKVATTEALQIKITLGKTEYKMGVGGLHSCEKSLAVVSDDNRKIIGADVTSYYPFVMLNMELFPQHLGKIFLPVFRDIVIRRLDAKTKGEKIIADRLKIAVNGTFGKTASPYSILYDVRVMLTTTVTGQLTLLMLIEDLELKGIRVISANTDGVVAVVEKNQRELYSESVRNWQNRTGFKLEYAIHDAYYAMNVNNYLALKQGGGIYGKGIFGSNKLMINPVNTVCNEAIIRLLTEKKPVEQTIYNWEEFTDFLTVRTVRGGAVYNGEYLGRAIRWYYSLETKESIIVYANTGNKVANSNGAKPVMVLPDGMPTDINYQRYIDECYKMLKAMGVK